jgi:hypothetical protein
MPVMIDDIEVMSDDGKITDSSAILEALGDDYKDNKSLDGVSDVLMLTKRFLDTKADYGKKLEGVIKKPTENATDQEKADYKKSLKKELGAPETREAYDFEPVEGVERNEGFISRIKDAFVSEGVPVDSASRIVKSLEEFQLETQRTLEAERESQFQDDLKKFQTDHPGDKLIIGSRTAIKAMIQFGNQDLVKALKDNKILDDPGNFDALKKLDIWPSHLLIWEKIGEAMKSDKAITNEGLPSEKENEPEKGTTEAVVHKAYDHPTSVADRKARGKNY